MPASPGMPARKRAAMVENEDAIDPDVRQSRLVSLVWLVPIVAVVVGLWLVWSTYQQRGPSITIVMDDAEGIQVDVTKVRLRSVDVGVVTDVSVSADLATVEVTARMVSEAASYMREGTRFWVVSPRIGPGGVSGLSTLLSGAYIAVEPGEGPAASEFVALETPPPFAATEPGRRFVLTAPQLGNVGRGSGVYYRGLRVGEVIDYRLRAEGEGLQIEVFVPMPDADLVRADSRFWLANGIDFELQGGGMRVAMTSLEAFLAGGVEFESPDARASPIAAAGAEFQLFASPGEAEDAGSARTTTFVARFEGDVGGLRLGSPVLFRGIRVGRVLDLHLEFDPDDETVRVPVTFELFGGRLFSAVGSPMIATREQLDALVANGLRAQLRSTNFVTGELGIALDVFPDTPPVGIDWQAEPPVVPTVPSSLDQLQATVQGALASFQALPLNEIGADLQRIVAGAAQVMEGDQIAAAIGNAADAAATLNGLLQRFDAELPALLAEVQATAEGADAVTDELRRTLAVARGVIETASSVVDGAATIPYDTQRLLQELRVLTRSLTSLVDYLERDPSALLRGRR